MTSENPEREGESAEPTPPAPGAHPFGEQVVVPDDISGIANLLEEGGPLEPQDVVDVEGRFGGFAARRSSSRT